MPRKPPPRKTPTTPPPVPSYEVPTTTVEFHYYARPYRGSFYLLTGSPPFYLSDQ